MLIRSMSGVARRTPDRRMAAEFFLPALLLGAGATHAQTAPGPDSSFSQGALQEITVTAQKRNENLQSVPVAVTALSASELQQAGIVSTQDLPALVPSLNFMNVGKFGQPRIRGIGTTADAPTVENPVATYVDGVYYANQGASVLSLNNIEQIEVDKGPQGTLFGRNATGGLIQIKTRDPSLTHFQGLASLSYENYDTTTGNAWFGGPVASNLAADLGLYVRDQGHGYGTNVLTGQEINKTNRYVARSKWIYTPSDSTRIVFIADYLGIKAADGQAPAPGTTPLGGAPALPGQDIAVPARYSNTLEQGGGSLRIEQGLGDLTFMSTSAYRKGTGTDFFPNVGQASTFLTNVQLHDFSEQASQEFQLQSASVSRLEWTTGVFLFYDDGGWNPIDLSGGALAPIEHIFDVTDQKTYSGAIYGQSTYKITQSTRVTAGLRYTTDQRKWHIDQTFAAPFDIPAAYADGDERFNKLTWRFALDHTLPDGTLVYVSANRGFKSGGFNDFLIPATPYKPEQLDAYELGAKSEFLEGHLRLNLAGFYYDYQNVQVNRYEKGILLIYNGAAAQVIGFEAEGEARLSPHFALNFGLSVLNDKYTSFPNADITSPAPGGGTDIASGSAKGNRLTATPDWTFDLSGTYSVPLRVGALELSANYFHSSGFYGSVDGRLRQPAYDLVGAQLGWVSDDKSWRISAFGRNLANELYATTLYTQANGDIVQYAPPRTFGVMIERKF
jgi:iron complex outermembrane receptor protein